MILGRGETKGTSGRGRIKGGAREKKDITYIEELIIDQRIGLSLATVEA